MVEEFIKDVCEILCIPVPSVSFDISRFLTDTMMAQCSPDGAVIYLKKREKPDPDYLFAVAHELRHVGR